MAMHSVQGIYACIYLHAYQVTATCNAHVATSFIDLRNMLCTTNIIPVQNKAKSLIFEFTVMIFKKFRVGWYTGVSIISQYSYQTVITSPIIWHRDISNNSTYRKKAIYHLLIIHMH